MKKLALIFFLVIGIGFASNAQSDTATTASFYISPNPVENDVTFRFSNLNKDIKVVRIYDIIGKPVAEIDLNGKTGYTTLTLDISALRAGIYFCNLYSDKGIIQSIKMIKNK